MTIGKSAGKSYAYLLGVYLGDGCVSVDERNYQMFRVNTIDEDFALAIQAAIKDCEFRAATIAKQIVKKSSKPNYALTCCDQDLCKMLVIDTLGKRQLPMLGSDEETKQLVIGLMDSEGFVAEKTMHKTGRAYYMGFKSCDPWVPTHFTQIVQSVGLKIGKVSQCPPYREHYKVPTRFHIKMQSWVDSGMRFNIKRKQERVDRWASTEPYSERSRFPRKLTSETLRQTV